MNDDDLTCNNCGVEITEDECRVWDGYCGECS